MEWNKLVAVGGLVVPLLTFILGAFFSLLNLLLSFHISKQVEKVKNNSELLLHKLKTNYEQLWSLRRKFSAFDATVVELIQEDNSLNRKAYQKARAELETIIGIMSPVIPKNLLESLRSYMRTCNVPEIYDMMPVADFHNIQSSVDNEFRSILQ